jgi:hypothetical protein
MYAIPGHARDDRRRSFADTPADLVGMQDDTAHFILIIDYCSYVYAPPLFLNFFISPIPASLQFAAMSYWLFFPLAIIFTIPYD